MNTNPIFPICSEPGADPGLFGHSYYQRAPPVSSAHTGFRCPPAIFLRLKTASHASVGGEDGGFRHLVRRAAASCQFVFGPSAYAYAPATDGGGTASRLIRSRIAVNNSLGTATSASWKVTYFECLATFAPIPELLTLRQAAELCSGIERTLLAWARSGADPVPLMIGTGAVRYSRLAYLEWIAGAGGNSTCNRAGACEASPRRRNGRSLKPVITGIALPDSPRLPLFLGKTGHCRKRLAKDDERSRIALFLGKVGLFGGVLWLAWVA